jgi:hypothetical protein
MILRNLDQVKEKFFSIQKNSTDNHFLQSPCLETSTNKIVASIGGILIKS